MPRPNRVQPDGTFLAAPARGTLMGNRGVLHDDAGRIGPARWRHRNWVCCALSFRGRHRAVTPPGRYTALFFLDEAVALAAGHRPCAECRRADFRAWTAAWAAAFGRWPGAARADAALHEARAVPGARRLRHRDVEARALADGAMIMSGGIPHLIRGDAALPCAPEGYGPPVPRPDGTVRALTNPVTLEVLRSGFRPRLHPTARA